MGVGTVDFFAITHLAYREICAFGGTLSAPQHAAPAVAWGVESARAEGCKALGCAREAAAAGWANVLAKCSAHSAWIEKDSCLRRIYQCFNMFCIEKPIKKSALSY